MAIAQIDQGNNKVKLHIRNSIAQPADLANLLTHTLNRAALLKDAFSVGGMTEYSDEFYEGAELVIRDIYYDLKAACAALDDLSTKNKG